MLCTLSGRCGNRTLYDAPHKKKKKTVEEADSFSNYRYRQSKNDGECLWNALPPVMLSHALARIHHTQDQRRNFFLPFSLTRILNGCIVRQWRHFLKTGLTWTKEGACNASLATLPVVEAAWTWRNQEPRLAGGSQFNESGCLRRDPPPNRRRGRSNALAGPVDCLPFAARPCSLRVNTAGSAITRQKTYDWSNERVAFAGFGGQTECRDNPMPSSTDVAGQCKQNRGAFQERGRAACPNT